MDLGGIPADAKQRQNQREMFRKMAANNMSLSEVKTRIERDATKEQARLRTMPGFRVQAKISALYQRRALTKKKDEGQIRQEYEMGLTPMTLEEDGTLEVPMSLREKPVEIAQTAEVTRIMNKVQQRMITMGLNEITQTTVLEYIATNPKKVEQYALEVRKEKVAESKRLKELRARRRHEHVFTQHLLLEDDSVRKGRFPKEEILASANDVRRACFGGRPDMLDTRGDERTASHFELPRLAQLATVSVASPTMAPPTTLAQFVAMSPTTPDGQDIVIDAATAASLTMNHGANIVPIQLRFDALYGTHLPLDLAQDTLESEHARVAPPPPQVLSRVDCGGAGSLSRARSTTPTKAHSGRSLLTPIPSPSSPAVVITNGPDVPVLSDDEMALLAVPQEADAKDADERRLLDPSGAAAAAAAASSTAPSGLYAKLIRDTDSYDGGSSGDDFEPLCVICRANRAPAQQMRHEPDRFSTRPHASATVATESLEHWRAMHQATNLARARSLRERFDRRHWSQAKAARSTEALRIMTREAESVASAWRNTRGLSPAALNSESVWVRPTQQKDALERNRAACRIFLQRLYAFCAMLQFPNTPQHLAFLSHMVDLLLRLQCVSRSLFFRWLHLCGPSVLSSRENFRIVTFVRLELQVSMTALQRWCRLSPQYQAGWKLSNEMM